MMKQNTVKIYNNALMLLLAPEIDKKLLVNLLFKKHLTLTVRTILTETGVITGQKSKTIHRYIITVIFF